LRSEVRAPEPSEPSKLTRAVRVAVDLPQVFWSEPVDVAEVRDRIQQVDELGFDGAWVNEDMLNETGTLDALTTLAYAAALTERVDLGVAVLLGPLYNPVHLAKATATLDQLSGGRLVLGLGLGADTGAYSAYGVPPVARAERFDQLVEGVQALWTGAEPPDGGTVFDVRGRRMQPRPLQAQPRLWFGGRSPGAFRRAGRYGNGFTGAGASTSARFAGYVEQLRALLDGAGRREFTIAKRVYIACDDHVAGASAQLHDWLAHRYQAVPSEVAVTGDLAACLAGLRRLVDAGADYLILSFVVDQECSIEWAARDFLPQLR
jgi:alkanesulfonate monooxygenase SsuD/methylene tetrahydromethanopterin reductase-like flavin-dependent oxidoreductase (luciferase family)